jgi:hypothetical protein
MLGGAAHAGARAAHPGIARSRHPVPVGPGPAVRRSHDSRDHRPSVVGRAEVSDQAGLSTHGLETESAPSSKLGLSVAWSRAWPPRRPSTRRTVVCVDWSPLRLRSSIPRQSWNSCRSTSGSSRIDRSWMRRAFEGWLGDAVLALTVPTLRCSARSRSKTFFETSSSSASAKSCATVTERVEHAPALLVDQHHRGVRLRVEVDRSRPWGAKCSALRLAS